MMIWMHFGDKMRGSSKLTFELVRGRQSESTILSIISCKRIVILSYFLRVMLVFVRGVGAVCVYDQPGDEVTLVKQMVSDRKYHIDLVSESSGVALLEPSSSIRRFPRDVWTCDATGAGVWCRDVCTMDAT
ncbi:hypothetical protein F2Q69_00006981 [Brassica cretica]|uniref:Uncharacterized protein n=1 Tax=Brassica cretica TaxID=69181 RepID=A0A8S9PJF8_BRACR|nr:hypothetical protein F2Q69_00006981 [Brassica cretica]